MGATCQQDMGVKNPTERNDVWNRTEQLLLFKQIKSERDRALYIVSESYFSKKHISLLNCKGQKSPRRRAEGFFFLYYLLLWSSVNCKLVFSEWRTSQAVPWNTTLLLPWKPFILPIFQQTEISFFVPKQFKPKVPDFPAQIHLGTFSSQPLVLVCYTYIYMGV